MLESKVKTSKWIYEEYQSFAARENQIEFGNNKWLPIEEVKKEINEHQKAFGLLWKSSCKLSEQIIEVNKILDEYSGIVAQPMIDRLRLVLKEKE
jgi:hypothetical protein